MNRTRSAWIAIPLGATVLCVALVQFFKHFPIMPFAASQEAVAIDRAFQNCLLLTLVLFSLVMAAVAYMLFTFREHPIDEEAPRIHHSRSWWFESLWIGTSVLLTLGLAVYGWHELRTIYGSPHADLDVEVRAEQFSWEFYYPKFDQLGSRLYLPVGKRVRIQLSAKDVVHSFWVPEFRMKQDAVPGKVTTLMFTPTQEGSYLLLCNQLCGRDHTIMTSYVDVINAEEFEKKFTGGGESW